MYIGFLLTGLLFTFFLGMGFTSLHGLPITTWSSLLSTMLHAMSRFHSHVVRVFLEWGGVSGRFHSGFGPIISLT